MSYFDYFESKEKAGEILADELEKIKVKKPFLLAIPRGGVQVAEAVAERFEVPINTIIAKKLPLPLYPEVAFGAMTEDEINILNKQMMKDYGISEKELKEIYNRVNEEIKHRIEAYGRFEKEDVKGAQAVIIDDGVATGSSLIAAIKRVESMQPSKLIVAVPVCTQNAYEKIKPMADVFISHIVDANPYFAVSRYYKEWKDLSEKEIIDVLNKYKKNI